MENNYIKLPNGQFVPDRRSDSVDLQQNLVKLIGKVETMESNLEIKLESVKDKISNLEEKVFNNIEMIDKKITVHCEDEDEVNDMLAEHDKKWEIAKQFVTRIHNLEKKYSELEERVDTLEKLPMVKKASWVDGLGTTIKNALFVSVGAAVVGILGMLILQYVRSL